MADDPNLQLGPFVEGMVMGALHEVIGRDLPGGWRCEAGNDRNGLHAVYFISPSGIRWRIRAIAEEPREKPPGYRSGIRTAGEW